MGDLPPSPAAVTSATAVEAPTTTAVETSAAAAYTSAAAKSATRCRSIAATRLAYEAATNSDADPDSATGIWNSRTTAITITNSVAAAEAISTTEPGSRADEDSAAKPFRAVVAIRRAGVRRIVVIAISASGRSVRIPRIASIRSANSNPYTNANLSMSQRRRQNEDREQSQIPENSHFTTPCYRKTPHNNVTQQPPKPPHCGINQQRISSIH